MYREIRKEINELIAELDLQEKQAIEDADSFEVMACINKKLGLYDALEIVSKNILKSQ